MGRSDNEIRFEPHEEYAAALAEIARLRQLVARLPALSEEAAREAEAKAEVAFEQVLEDTPKADRLLVEAATARGRLELLERHKSALEARLAELERLTGPGGRLRRENEVFVADQADPRRREVLRRFVATVGPAVQELLEEVERIEEAVAAAGGRVDPHWARPLDDTARTVRSVEEMLAMAAGLERSKV